MAHRPADYNLNLDLVLEQNAWTPGIDQPPGVRAQRGEQVVVGPDGVLGLSAAGLITLVVVKIAISIPVSGVERFERIAAHHGMNRSPFFQRAGRKLADELVGESELAALANAALARAGQPSDDGSTLAESQRIITQRSPW